MTGEERRRILDEEHLRLLSVFYYVSGGITALVACIPLVHVALGMGMVLISAIAGRGGQRAAPALVGGFFVAMGGAVVLLGWTLAALKIWVARCLSQHRHHTLCLVIAVLTCLAFPYGTVLGSFTLVVLLRDSVRALFAEADGRTREIRAGSEEA